MDKNDDEIGTHVIFSETNDLFIVEKSSRSLRAAGT